MRLDVFLKTSRLVKRRSVARGLCESGRVLVNGREAKPAREVGPGDVITLRFPSRTIDLEVVAESSAFPEKAKPQATYRITADTRLPKEEDSWSENPS